MIALELIPGETTEFFGSCSRVPESKKELPEFNAGMLEEEFVFRFGERSLARRRFGAGKTGQRIRCQYPFRLGPGENAKQGFLGVVPGSLAPGVLLNPFGDMERCECGDED